ncbi:MAG: response regulator [Pseudomonadota bacterium]
MLQGKRILIIDDSEAERMLISTYLQDQGARIYQAQDGIDGIHKARLLIPDLILMDLDMPRCDGCSACKMLQEEHATQQVPVIFLSAYSDPEQRVKGLLAGAVDFIGKPFHFDEVKLRMAVHLDRGEAAPTVPDSDPSEDQAFPQASGGEKAHLYEILFHSARIHLLKSLADAPVIQQLAREVGTNPKRLNQAFKYCSGLTVLEYLREQRMKEARKLLTQCSMPIRDVALSVGFNSSANFGTAFKERFGTTPSRFRRQDDSCASS